MQSTELTLAMGKKTASGAEHADAHATPRTEFQPYTLFPECFFRPLAPLQVQETRGHNEASRPFVENYEDAHRRRHDVMLG